MKRYVVYEVWTVARVVEAASASDAYKKGEPAVRTDGLSLCNWHAVEVPGETAGTLPSHGGLRILPAEVPPGKEEAL